MKKILLIGSFMIAGQLHISAGDYVFKNDTYPSTENETVVDRDSFVKGGSIKVKAYGEAAVEALGLGVQTIEIKPGEEGKVNLGAYFVHHFEVEGITGDIKGLKMTLQDPLREQGGWNTYNIPSVFRVIRQENEEQTQPNIKKIYYNIAGYPYASSQLIKKSERKVKTIGCKA